MGSPLWWKLLNTPLDEFSRNADGKWQINKYETLRKIAPNLYEAAEKEVQEFNSYQRAGQKVQLGKKVGSILAKDYFLHPELAYDPDALKTYWDKFPGLRAERNTKNGKLAKGKGFDLRKGEDK